MSKKKKTPKSAQTRKDQRHGRPGHKYHRSDIVLGFFLILLVPALGFLGYYLLWRERPEEPIPSISEAEISEIAPWERDDSSAPAEDFEETPEQPIGPDEQPPSFTEEELAACRAAAEAGDAESCYLLGKYYFDGADKEYDQAAGFFRRAAEQGHVGAQFRIGLCYDLGKGVQEDEREAVYWYRKAADGGNVRAQYCLGECFDYGHGVPKDTAAADRWFMTAAEQGDAMAEYKVGMRYTASYNMPGNLDKAFVWFQKAAEQGYPDAQYWLGRCYSRGDGIESDPEKAAEWYRRAAEQGHAVSQNALAECYAKGIGVPRDAAEAARWYRRAADRGDPDARRTLRTRPQ